MRCPQCKNKLVQRAGDVVRVRVKGILEIHPDGTCRAKCFWCNSDVAVPLALLPGQAATEGEKFTMGLDAKTGS